MLHNKTYVIIDCYLIADPMSVDGSPAVTRQDGIMTSSSDTESAAHAVHSFSGKLQEAISTSKPGPSSEKPSTSSEPQTPKLSTESKSLSTRLPGLLVFFPI